MSFSLEAIQDELKARGMDGWLFYDFYGRDAISYAVLDIPYGHVKRRWYYFVPAQGAPRKLVHKIESTKLDPLPGEKTAYASWGELTAALETMLQGCTRIAMQYSPNNAIPIISTIDAGTVELLRGMGKEIVSSADMVQRFEAPWSAEQVEMHYAAGKAIDEIVAASFARIAEHVRAGKALTEYEQQQWMLEQFEAHGVATESGPDVAINEHASDPHFEPAPEVKREFRKGDWVLLDVWAKSKRPGSVYYDVTWVGYLGDRAPERHQEIFGIVKEARDAAIGFVKDAFAQGREIRGFEVDDAARGVITRHGYADYFFHRTGHSIGEEVHGNGANMDNLETHDERVVLPGTCFSIEPGIYLPEFGVRLEVDMIASKGKADVTGRIQEEIVRMEC